MPNNSSTSRYFALLSSPTWNLGLTVALGLAKYFPGSVIVALSVSRSWLNHRGHVFGLALQRSTKCV